MELQVQENATRSNVTVQDILMQLGADVTDEKETKPISSTTSTTSMVVFRSAPTVKALGVDLVRLAATTADNPESARRHWEDRQIMVFDAQGKPTRMPLIITVTFSGANVISRELPDIGISANETLEGLGHIEIRPLFVTEVPYIKPSEQGQYYIGIREFIGGLFAPKRQGDAYRFVPLDFADPALLQRWNLIVEEGRRNKTIHGNWPLLTPAEISIGKPRKHVMTFAPVCRQSRPYTVFRRRGPVREEWNQIGVYFGKSVLLHPKSQQVPEADILENISALDKGKSHPDALFVFSVIERENAIEVFLLGRPGEVNLAPAMTIQEQDISYNPFDVLNTTVERFESQRVEKAVGAWLGLPINADNPLYTRAVELGLVVEGQARSAIRSQLTALANDAYTKAKELWIEALEETWKQFQRMSFPDLNASLAGKTLEDAIKTLNAVDVAAAWITSHISGEYIHRSPFYRTLRERLLREMAKRCGYDPSVTVKPEISTATESVEVVAAAPAEVTDKHSIESSPVIEKPKTRARKPRAPKQVEKPASES